MAFSSEGGKQSKVNLGSVNAEQQQVFQAWIDACLRMD